MNGIRTDIAEFVFAGAEELDYWGSLCTHNLSVPSMYAATKLYCTPKEIEAGTKMLGEYCIEYGNVSLVPYAEVLPSLTDDFIASLQVVEFTDIDATKIWNNSILISSKFAEAGRKTTGTFQMQYILHARYGWAVYGFWGGILVIGMINRLSNYILQRRCVSSTKDVESTTSSTKARTSTSGPFAAIQSIHHWIRANLIIPAAFGSHHQRLLWWCNIPTRMETVIVTAFWILNLILCCISYDIFYPNLYYTEAIQAWRYISDRTGIICYANLPILWMFSGRNNIFLWLTGWSFSTFNVFHRHVARIATIQAIVHSIGYTALEINYDSLAESWKEQYWYMGGMATITMGLLLFFSSIFFRRKSYEVFLILHIGLSVITIVGLFYHTAIFDGEYNGYLWPLVAIWSFDRAARFVRIAFCNLHLKFSRTPMTTSAIASYDANSELIRLDVTPGSSILKPVPGQHYYLYQPLRWKGWENHPFTLASWSAVDNKISEPTAGTQREANGKEKEIHVTPTEAASNDSSSDVATSSQTTKPSDQAKAGRTTLSFLIRPFDSWTVRLRNECLKSPSGSIKAQILIEGPYGERSPLHTFENVIFIVGGTGISGALPYLQEFVNTTTSQSTETSRVPMTRTRDITLVWVTRQPAMIHDVARRELQPVFGRDDVHISLHATKPKETPPAPKIVNTEKSPNAIQELEISYSRPNIRETILNVVNRVHADGSAGGKIAILTCGPASMADEARAAVHTALKEGKRSVEYFEESFGW